MKKLLITCIGMLFALNSYGQDLSVSVAPYSFKAWGKATGISEVAITIDFDKHYGIVKPLSFGVHYFQPTTEFKSIIAVPKGSEKMAFPLKEIVGLVDEEHDFFKRNPPNKHDYIFTGDYQPSMALSYTPLYVKKIIKGGLIFSYRGFPTGNSVHTNFFLDIGYNFNQFRLSYTHISNGFGLQTRLNFGYDNIRISYFFK